MFLEHASKGLLKLSGIITEYFSHIIGLCMSKVLFCSTPYKTGFFFFLQARLFHPNGKDLVIFLNEIISNDTKAMGLANFKMHILKTQRCVNQIMV